MVSSPSPFDGKGEGIKLCGTTLTSILSLQGRARKSSRVTSMAIAINEFFWVSMKKIGDEEVRETGISSVRDHEIRSITQ